MGVNATDDTILLLASPREMNNHQSRPYCGVDDSTEVTAGNLSPLHWPSILECLEGVASIAEHSGDALESEDDDSRKADVICGTEEGPALKNTKPDRLTIEITPEPPEGSISSDNTSETDQSSSRRGVGANCASVECVLGELETAFRSELAQDQCSLPSPQGGRDEGTNEMDVAVTVGNTMRAIRDVLQTARVRFSKRTFEGREACIPRACVAQGNGGSLKKGRRQMDGNDDHDHTTTWKICSHAIKPPSRGGVRDDLQGLNSEGGEYPAQRTSTPGGVDGNGDSGSRFVNMACAAAKRGDVCALKVTR